MTRWLWTLKCKIKNGEMILMVKNKSFCQLTISSIQTSKFEEKQVAT